MNMTTANFSTAALDRIQLEKLGCELADVRAELAICGHSELARFQQLEADLVCRVTRLKSKLAELSA
jgi:hypothetical protein